jgi:prepilin-type N-terminal cleavage/methylation domain-containing protein
MRSDFRPIFVPRLAASPCRCASGREGGARYRRGFTLLELLIAMTMAAIVAASLYSALRIGFRAESSAEAALEPIRTAELSMGLLRPDFESAVAPGGVLKGTFLGTDSAGDANTAADTVEFFTLGDPLDVPPTAQTSGGGMLAGGTFGGPGRSGNATAVGAAPAGTYGTVVPGAGEVRMIDLLVLPAPSGNVLVRRVTTNLLSTGTPDVYDEVVCRGVRSFNLRYYDGSAWQESWDSTLQENNCPTAVEVTIDLQRGTGDQARVVRFTRVFLLSCSGLWSPTATTAAGGTGQ